MGLVDILAERRIKQAADEGAFDYLEGAGKPLRLDEDNPFVPPESRMALRVMKNAGLLPPELELRKEIAGINQLIRATCDEGKRTEAKRRLRFLLTRLDVMHPGRNLAVEREYYVKLMGHFEGDPRGLPDL